jgi:transposase-like protein
VVTDRAWTLLAVVDELIPGAFHNTARYANNRIEADHGRLKARLRPMRGLKGDHTARVIVHGHAFMQNLRRGHYELGVEAHQHRRVANAFTELARAI